MSITVMTLVWEKFPGNGSELLAMLAMADWCNDSGGSLHPSVATVAKKIRLSECQARRIIHGLIEQGYLFVVGNHNGGDPGMTRQYQMNLAKLRAIASDTPVVDATPIAHARDPYHPCTSTPSADATLTVIEPSITTNTSSAKKANKVDFVSGEFVGLTGELLATWRKAYPQVNHESELRKAAAWLMSNPGRQKKVYARFLNGWMARAQKNVSEAKPAKFDPLAYINQNNRSAGDVIDSEAYRLD